MLKHIVVMIVIGGNDGCVLCCWCFVINVCVIILVYGNVVVLTIMLHTLIGVMHCVLCCCFIVKVVVDWRDMLLVCVPMCQLGCCMSCGVVVFVLFCGVRCVVCV